MRKMLILSSLLSTLIFPAAVVSAEVQNAGYCEETISVDDYSPVFRYGLGFTETQLANVILLGFNRYISQSDYGMISWNSMWTNLTNPWVWDQDEFVVNHLGHPYQGSTYYSAARTAGNNFWASASITGLGSVTWELLMETETPSVNDFIVTTLGGVALGEMFFRLSDVILHDEDGTNKNPGKGRWAGASLLAPTTSINNGLRPDRPPEKGDLHGFSYGAAGFSLGDVSILPRPNDYHLSSYGISCNYILDLEYNTPFIDRDDSAPYDWFNIRSTAGIEVNNQLFLTFFSAGHLFGWTFYSDNIRVRNQLGFYLHYDFIYNSFLNLGANAIGGGWQRTGPLGKNWTLNSSLFLSFVPMGASDIIFLKYNDIVEGNAPDYERRNYSLSMGANAKLGLSFVRKDSLYINLGYSGYNLYIIDGSVPENGSGGIELIGVTSISMKYMITDSWFAGFQHSLYHKESFYRDYYGITLEELLHKFEITFGFRF